MRTKKKRNLNNKNPYGIEWTHFLKFLKVLVLITVLSSSFHWIILKKTQHEPMNIFAQSLNNDGVYSVKKGDTLWEIALNEYPKRNTEEVVGEIKKINQLTSDSIQDGQPLRLPQ